MPLVGLLQIVYCLFNNQSIRIYMISTKSSAITWIFKIQKSQKLQNIEKIHVKIIEVQKYHRNFSSLEKNNAILHWIYLLYTQNRLSILPNQYNRDTLLTIGTTFLFQFLSDCKPIVGFENSIFQQNIESLWSNWKSSQLKTILHKIFIYFNIIEKKNYGRRTDERMKRIHKRFLAHNFTPPRKYFINIIFLNFWTKNFQKYRFYSPCIHTPL